MSINENNDYAKATRLSSSLYCWFTGTLHKFEVIPLLFSL